MTSRIKQKAIRNIRLRPESHRRLNWLRDEVFKADDQSDAIDRACLKLTGSLEPWKERE